MSPKKNTSKQNFQLKPKHLVKVALGVCVTAIIALVIGVVGTFNPHDETRAKEEKQQEQKNINHVEVWKPAGASSNTQSNIVLNPDAVNSNKNQPPQSTQEKGDHENTNGTAAVGVAAKAEADDESEEERPQRRYRTRPVVEERGERMARVEKNRVEVAKTAEKPAVQAAEAAVAAPVAQPERVRQAATPEQRQEPKAERRVAEDKPKPKPVPEVRATPEPKRQPKELMDNLF